MIVIENEFGDVGIDTGFLDETGVQIRELASGCICVIGTELHEESVRALFA